MTELVWNRDDDLQRATSEPPGYFVEWSRSPVQALHWNAWFGEGTGRKNLYGGWSGHDAKAACQRHFDELNRTTFDALKPSAQPQPAGDSQS